MSSRPGMMDAVMRVAVYGAKSVPEASAKAALDAILPPLRPSVVWFGGCGFHPRGVDLATLEWSARNLVATVTTEADWHQYGTRCGEVRGRWVAAWCGTAVAIWDPYAPEPDGTLAHLVREALLLKRRTLMAMVAEDFVIDRVLDSNAIDASFLLGPLSRPRLHRRRHKAA